MHHAKGSALTHPYSIDGIAQDQLHAISGSHSLHPCHLKNVTATLFARPLGFVIKSSSEFENPSTFKTLYSTVALPYLNYCSTLWNPLRQVHVASSEQNQHLRFVGYKLKEPIPKTCHVCDPLLNSLAIPALEERRSVSDWMFAIKILNNFLDSPDDIRTFQARCST